MKFKRTLIILMGTLILNTGISYGILVDENKVISNVASGVTQETITQLFEGGVQKINLLKIDTKAVELDILISSSGFEKREKLSNLVKTEGNTLAAINGDFFSMSNPTFTLNAAVKNGEAISSPHYEENKYANLIVGADNSSRIEYLKHSEQLKNLTKGSVTGVTAVNKPSKDNAGIIVYTDEYRKNSLGVSKTYYDMTEVVVEKGVVTDVRVGKPAVAIPSDGFVVSAAASNSFKLQQNFSVGDNVSLENNFTLNYPNTKTSIGGGSMLVKNGGPTALSQNTARSQRSAIGITPDNNIILMAVDGRTAPYIGMTEADVQNYMMGLGVKEAMLLDGGGSTELIVGGVIQNYVPAERELANGLAIQSTSPLGVLTKIDVLVHNPILIQGESTKLTVRGFDANGNVVNLSGASFSSEGVNGSYNGYNFTPSTSGRGSLVVTASGVTGRVDIDVLPNAAQDFRSQNLSDFEIGIITDTSSGANDIIDKVIVGKLKQGINMGEYTLSFNNKNQETLNEVTTAKDSVTGAMQTKVHENTNFITVDGSKDIGSTSGQWNYIKSALSGNASNIVIMSNSELKISASEKNVWNKLLEEAEKTKNIYFVTKGTTYSGAKHGNVSYIKTRDISTIKSPNKEDYKYLVFKEVNGELSYSFKNIL
ncbi:MAG: phosphodiester glycosidase family protein [Filifactoraceae bacterium]